MTTSVGKPREPAVGAPPPSELPAAVAWVVPWVKGHRNLATGIGVVVLVGGGLAWWTVVSRGKVEGGSKSAPGAGPFGARVPQLSTCGERTCTSRGKLLRYEGRRRGRPADGAGTALPGADPGGD